MNIGSISAGPHLIHAAWLGWQPIQSVQINRSVGPAAWDHSWGCILMGKIAPSPDLAGKELALQWLWSAPQPSGGQEDVGRQKALNRSLNLNFRGMGGHCLCQRLYVYTGSCCFFRFLGLFLSSGFVFKSCCYHHLLTCVPHWAFEAMIVLIVLQLLLLITMKNLPFPALHSYFNSCWCRDVCMAGMSTWPPDSRI